MQVCGQQVCFRPVNNVKSLWSWNSLNYTFKKFLCAHIQVLLVFYVSDKRASDIGEALKHTSWLKWAVIITLRVFAIHRWPNCLRRLTYNSLRGRCIISLRTKPGKSGRSCSGNRKPAVHSDASKALKLPSKLWWGVQPMEGLMVLRHGTVIFAFINGRLHKCDN